MGKPPVRYKPVSRGLLPHPVERRGFVTVPLDPRDASLGTIDVFYRLIPAEGSTPDDATKPIVVVFNGGPGVPGSAYRPLDYDYENPDDPKHGGVDRFRLLRKTHRVLLADQRGTDGLSAPIDMEDPSIDARFIAKHFSSDSHARDYAAVINAVIPANQPFFIIAQSYGGMPGMQYLGLEGARLPTGIVFSSSALPYEDAHESMLARRREQLALNRQLAEAVPAIRSELEAVRQHLAAVGLNPDQVHALWSLLGKGPTGVWEHAFAAELKKVMGRNRSEIAAEFAKGFGELHLLNYILSSSNMTPGYTDRGLAAESSALVPFEPWMLDENWIMLNSLASDDWRCALLDDLDRNPPDPTPLPTLAHLRNSIANTHALFTAADNDAFVPADGYRKAIEKFSVPGHTEMRALQGGHDAIFLRDGHENFLAWSRALV